MSFFSEDHIRQIEQEYSLVIDKQRHLASFFTSYNFANEKATEYARHGYLRRIYTIVHCIERVFEKFPPNQIEIPSREMAHDATIALQAFVFNTFGVIDNLAWIWVSERGLKKAGGAPISGMHIGLGPKNKIVRLTFSDEFQQYLQGLDNWFSHLENFRHALAHRIPLYIPPYCIVEEDLEAYLSLEKLSIDALAKGDVNEHNRLIDQKEKLRVFQPIMTHSYLDKAKKVIFHSQMLADFNTIDELSRKFIEELKATTKT